jgi:predicted transcriptional regulator
MKTAVSLPDKIFHAAERQARRLKKSRSQLYGEALAEYLARHAADRVEEALNDVCGRLGDQRDAFVSEASRRTLGRSEW